MDITLDPNFIRGVELFNAAEYLEASDCFEELFFEGVRDEPEFARIFLQFSVGIHHAEMGHTRPAVERIEEGLRVVASNRNDHGIDLPALATAMKDGVQHLRAKTRPVWPRIRRRAPALVFDFGNVLVTWDPRRVFRSFFDSDAAIDDFLAEIGFTGWNIEQDRGRPWSEAVTDLCARFPDRAELIRAYDERWEESIAGAVPGTVRIIERLRALGYPLFGLSNWSSEKFRLTRPRYPVFELFDDIVISADVGMVKPDADIFQALLARIGRGAGECLFIDDSEWNTSAAAALGFDTIRFVSPEQLEGELAARGIVVAKATGDGASVPAP